MFTQMLDSVFKVPPIYDDSAYGYRIHEISEMQTANMGNYAHGNQPSQHMLYLYGWTSEAWKGQMHIRETMDRLYGDAPDGYCGDEDNGQTSAWYIFSALGFYPVCPASGQYICFSIPMSSCLTSPRTTSTSRASSGSKTSLLQVPTPLCLSVTTGLSSTTSPTAPSRFLVAAYTTTKSNTTNMSPFMLSGENSNCVL